VPAEQVVQVRSAVVEPAKLMRLPAEQLDQDAQLVAPELAANVPDVQVAQLAASAALV
jgi:hypothetical protein